MESPVRTSFIPQQALKSPVPTRSSRPGTIGLLTIIAVVIFVASAVASGGIFFYHQYLQTTLQSKINSLENLKGAFNLELIDELSRISARLTAADSIVNQHVALSRLFDFLEQTTLQAVRYKSFAYGPGPAVGTYAVALEGEASSFASVALQSDEYAEAQIFTRATFGGLNANDQGDVVFKVQAEVNGEEILFSKTIGEVPDSVTISEDAISDLTSSIAEDKSLENASLSDEDLFGEESPL
jgi:hypothetical protein